MIVICVPTPLDENAGPDLGAVEAAAKTIAESLRPPATVILESTTYPGTTENLVLPLLESHGAVHGRDFYLAYSPERVDPGSATYGITNTPKLVGGISAEATSVPLSSMSASSTPWCRSLGRRRPRPPNCWRTPIGM